MSEFFKAINAISNKPLLEILPDVHLEQMFISRPNNEVAYFKKENRFLDFNFTQFSEISCINTVSCHRISVKRYKSVNCSIIAIAGKSDIVIDSTTLKDIFNISKNLQPCNHFYYHFSTNLQMFGEPEECKISLKLNCGVNRV